MTGVTWRKQCPVGLEDLRAIDLHHLDMQGARQAGTLIVHHDVAHDVAGVFQALLQAGFPLTSVRPMRHFGGDDNASMAADNTSGFNCRPVAGTPRWSEHAYGRAIDVNPLRNPYVRGSNVQPPEGKGYLERDPAVPGLITEGDAADTAFSAIGWRWGGRWRSSKDFQHFSKSGR
ncbi:MAG: M15 family peptidase [Deltaproteobacteria bacterium]|nr:MAG: M15 family peptidase [Deltaproteobacteria bacterium]